MKKSVFALLLSSVMAGKTMADDVFSVPFVDDFDANTKRELFTTIDANNDGVTWKRHYKQSILPGFYPDTDFKEMEYDSGSATQSADDWFITPKIHLEAGKVYSFAFNAYVAFDGYQQVMEVKMGQGVKVEDMTELVMKSTTISSSGPQTFEQEFTVEQDGDYNFGMHVTSLPDHSSLYFTHLVVKQSSSDAAPAKITDLKAQPDATGKLSAVISFTAPSKTVGGSELTALTKVELSRNGSLVKTLSDVKPGQEVTYEDKGANNGYNSYMAVAYNEQGKGIRTVLDSVYIGVDRPLPPTGFTLTDKGNEILITWNKVADKGYRGMVVNPDGVTYIVEALNSSYESQEELVRTQELQYRYAFNTQDGEQDLKRFGVRATNVADWSEFAYARMVVGKPYNLPYRESFATGNSHGLIWQEGAGTFYATTSDAADADAGCVQFYATRNGEQVSFNLGKMNMRLAQHPVMKFQYKGLGVKDSIVVYIEHQGGTKEEVCTLKGWTSKWKTTTIDLQKFAGENYIIPKLLTTGSTGHSISFDDFQVLDLYDADLAVELEAEATDEGMIKAEVTVTNEGMKEAAGYEVVLSVDGKEAKRIVATEFLAAGYKTVLKSELPFVAQADDQVELKAQVVWLYDLNPDNDLASVQVTATKTVLGGNEDATLVALLKEAGGKGVNIYSTDGRLVRSAATSFVGLKEGIYIIGGKKICVTK